MGANEVVLVLIATEGSVDVYHCYGSPTFLYALVCDELITTPESKVSLFQSFH